MKAAGIAAVAVIRAGRRGDLFSTAPLLNMISLNKSSDTDDDYAQADKKCAVSYTFVDTEINICTDKYCGTRSTS